MLHGCPPSPDAWGRLNVVTPFHHLSGDSHINSSLREGPLRHLALLWQIYSRCFSLQIHFLQRGHRCGGGRAMSSRMAWRTAGNVGRGGGPLILFFPPCCFKPAILEESVGDHRHERMTVKALPGSALEVIETKFFFQLLVSLLANPSRLDGGR